MRLLIRRLMRILIQPWIFLLSTSLLLSIPTAQAAQHIQDAQAEVKAFLDQQFQTVPKPKSLWLTGKKKQQVSEILGHPYPKIRLAYWQDGEQTAFIVEEIGKTLPITVGIALKGQQIERVQILKFRESRGWEVKLPSFTQQFAGASLASNQALSNSIDGISGATLSVRAVTKLSKMVLAMMPYISK